MKYLLIVFVLLSCLIEADRPPDVYTDLGIGVHLNRHNPDLDLIDQKYADMCLCTGQDPDTSNDFTVEIKTDAQQWDCYWPGGERGTCRGQYIYWEANILITEDLDGLAHEIGHRLADKYQGDAHIWTHHQCSPAMNCGHFVVDPYYDHEPWPDYIPSPKCTCILTDAPRPKYEIVDTDGDGICDPGILGGGLLLPE